MHMSAAHLFHAKVVAVGKLAGDSRAVIYIWSMGLNSCDFSLLRFVAKTKLIR